LYGNARTADLFKGISDVYGKDISKMMENWTTKIGFPLITVEETDKGLKIRQNRFLSTADATVSLVLSCRLNDRELTRRFVRSLE
jgi:aminopeptidase 2